MITAVNSPTYAIGEKKPEKISESLNGIRTNDLSDTGAMLPVYQLIKL